MFSSLSAKKIYQKILFLNMGYIAIAFVDSPSKVFEQGYGKDAATIAMHAISAARDQKYDVVLIDTAGIFSFKMTVQISLAQN